MCTPLQEYFGATETYITKYRAVFETALEGEAVRMMHDARRAYVSCLNPFFCAFLRGVEVRARPLCAV